MPAADETLRVRRQIQPAAQVADFEVGLAKRYRAPLPVLSCFPGCHSPAPFVQRLAIEADNTDRTDDADKTNQTKSVESVSSVPSVSPYLSASACAPLRFRARAS